MTDSQPIKDTAGDEARVTKVITFMGVNPRKTTYEMPDKEEPKTLCEAAYCGIALAHWRHRLGQKSKLYVFVTEDAKVFWADFKAAVKDHVEDAVCVAIPDGENEAQLWEIFEEVVKTVEENDRVVFDMTHGFRSLPFLSFLAAAYLRTVKQVKLESLLYGNFEAARKRNPPTAPVVDMTPFLSLLDWTVAADQFIHTGDARRLAGLLNPSGASDGPTAAASRSLTDVSLSAFLCQPFELMPAAQELEASLTAAATALDTDARPYRAIHRQIVEEFGTFGAAPDADDKTKLRAQFRLIQWYHTNNQLIQAMTLAREWLISAITVELNLRVDLKKRKDIEDNFKQLSDIGKTKQRRDGTPFVFGPDDMRQYAKQMYTWPNWRELAQLRKQLSNVRNALDHAGYQSNPLKMNQIVQDIDNTIMPKLCALAEKWGYIEKKQAELSHDPTQLLPPPHPHPARPD